MTMTDIHPGETELARFSDGAAGAGVAEHVRWCARCRSVVADYAWLGGEIGATLAAAADAVPVPRPRWWAVQEHLLAGQRRVAGWRASALASVMLAFCLMLSLSPVLGPAAVARTLLPEAATAPAPETAAVPGASLVPLATPTPAIADGQATPAPTPAFALPPTPPAPDA
jgi:hypothetical protein